MRLYLENILFVTTWPRQRKINVMANSFCIAGEIGLSDKWSQKGGFKTIRNFKPIALKVIAVTFCESWLLTKRSISQ